MTTKKHIINYFKRFSYTEGDWVPCEIPKCNKSCNDFHHIQPKGMGGSKSYEFNGRTYDINDAHNIIALCRKHHEDAHAHVYSKDELRLIHNYKLSGRNNFM